MGERLSARRLRRMADNARHWEADAKERVTKAEAALERAQADVGMWRKCAADFDALADERDAEGFQ